MGKEATGVDTTSSMHGSDVVFSHYLRLTSTAALEVMLNLLPLDVFLQGEAGAVGMKARETELNRIV